MVTLFLDTAELRVKEQIPLSITYWKEEADNVIQFSRKPLLQGKGTISHEQAKEFAEKQYHSFENERKKAEALEADMEDQKKLDELIKKIKKQ
jgi:hypothetical protein